MRNRRTRIATDVRHTGFQQSLGNRENAFASENLAVAQTKLSTSFLNERSAMELETFYTDESNDSAFFSTSFLVRRNDFLSS